MMRRRIVLVTLVFVRMVQNFQGCQVHWGDQEFAAGVHHKSLPISSARGANILVHLHNTLSTYAPDFPHLVLSTCTWLFSGSIPLQVAVEESCIYTCTPDWNPVIDTVPGSHNVVFAVGFSGDNLIFLKRQPCFFSKIRWCHSVQSPGTGFKLGPVTGRMLADLAQVFPFYPFYSTFYDLLWPSMAFHGQPGSGFHCLLSILPSYAMVLRELSQIWLGESVLF